MDKKQAIVVASFGTVYKDTCEKTVGRIENALREAFPHVPVRRAFTSGIILKMLRNNGDFETKSLKEAVESLKSEGFTHIFVQPTHIMRGPDYESVKNEALMYEGVSVGVPLLSNEADCGCLALVLQEELALYEDHAIVLAGHGAEEPYNNIYAQLEDKIGRADYFVGVLHGEPSVHTILQRVKQSGHKRVCLAPLTVSFGGHARKNVMGDGEGSWKTLFEREGFEVVCHEKGIGEYEGVAKMICNHAKSRAFVISK